MSLSKTLFAALIVAVSTTASYAQKCQFDVDKTDPVTNVPFRSVIYDITPTGSFRNAVLEQKGNNFFMTFEISQPGKLEGKVHPGTEVLMNTQNGGSVLLFASEENAPVYKTEGGNTTTTWIAKCPLSKNDLTALSLSPISQFRADFAQRDMRQPASADASKIQKAAKCMLK